MTKSDLIMRISEIYPYMSVRNVNKVVSIIFESIVDALKDDCRVELRGFGSFWIKDRGKAQRRNPRTGEKVVVAERRVPFFKAGKQLKEQINNGSMETEEE